MSNKVTTNVVTIALTTELQTKLAELAVTREGKTVEELVLQCVERGAYDLCYRTKRNREQWQQYKQWKQSTKA